MTPLPRTAIAALAVLPVLAVTLFVPLAANAAEPAYVGLWASDSSACTRDPASVEPGQVTLRLRPKGSSQDGRTCAFGRVAPVRDPYGSDRIWSVTATCGTGRAATRERFTLRVEPDGTLRQEYAGRAREPRPVPLPIPLVRCP